MKRVIFFVFIVHYVTISNSRLIEKVPEVKTTTVSQTSTLPIRLRRHFIYQGGSAFQPKEEPFQNVFEKKSKTFLNNNRLLKDTISRIPRQSNVTKKEEIAPVNSEKRVLVKKPIPKFNEMDEYYVEPKSFKLARFVESDENEDEDFNLDDYDFDIKHDEYVGRGKPSVPRKEDNATSTPRDAASEVLKVARTIDTSSDGTLKTTKLKRLDRIEEKKQKERDDYDYDASTSTRRVESKETEESKEYDRLRGVRSASFKKNMLYDKNAKAVKLPFMLPMFPEQLAPATERDKRKDII